MPKKPAVKGLEKNMPRAYMVSRMKKMLVLLIVLLALPLYSSRAMTYEEEGKIANEFITLLESNNLIIHDQEITLPVQMIADRMADHIKDPVYSFKIHVIKDRSVNAFTIPDGHIFINLGTLLFAQDIDEISAVIGHEMGHSQMRHIPENFETQKKISMASILGVLAGTILSTKNPEAGAALVFSSMGGSENIKLAYSRQFEYDADNFGKDIMSVSGIDPSAMVRFLIRLRALSGSSDIPEYLLTHPYTENRIVNMKEDPGKPKPDKNFWMLDASVVGLTMPEGEAKARSAQIPQPYRSLALGLLQTRLGNNQQALEVLAGVDLPLAYAYRGINLFALGRKEEAFGFLKDYAGTARTKLALADILKERGDFKEAIEILLPFQAQNMRIDYALGTLYEKTSKPMLAHVSYARYFYRAKNYRSSIYHIDKALESEKELPKDMVSELKSMQDVIKKSQQEKN
jgi:beta-barrel assembly-enhancing protease